MRNYFSSTYAALLTASVLMIVLFVAYQLQLTMHYINLPSYLENMDGSTFIKMYYSAFTFLFVIMLCVLPNLIHGIKGKHGISSRASSKDGGNWGSATDLTDKPKRMKSKNRTWSSDPNEPWV